jgi:hypothetical protein
MRAIVGNPWVFYAADIAGESWQQKGKPRPNVWHGKNIRRTATFS